MEKISDIMAYGIRTARVVRHEPVLPKVLMKACAEYSDKIVKASSHKELERTLNGSKELSKTLARVLFGAKN